ncbi:hypothetical protein G6F37_013325 [Rhizopus arrhizus]|nr:hypothetical protein G6F38_013266 [Rhizopus arrhizus]KAG1138447.1 hypothetical protein G6F37_013325 [Rhizopus arrhizus]
MFLLIKQHIIFSFTTIVFLVFVSYFNTWQNRDILPIIGIHLTGVATNWDDNKVKFDDSIEDSEYIPNVSNAGTPDEHEALLLTLQSHIDKNQQIDVHSLCNLPEAVVKLDTPGDWDFRPRWINH